MSFGPNWKVNGGAMTLDEEKRLLGNYRGRRLLACNAADTLSHVVDNLGFDDGKHLPPPDHSLPGAPTDEMRAELQNAVALVLRLVLAANDGCCSRHRLPRF